MPGSQITTIVASIATLLDAVTGVQRVYTYEPIVTNPGDIVTIMGGSQALDYWTVRPEISRPQRLVGFQMEVDHIVRFRHYYDMGAVATSTAALDTIVQAVMNAFNNTFSLVPQAEITGPVEVTWPEPWQLGGTFIVHRTEYRLPVHELYETQ